MLGASSPAFAQGLRAFGMSGPSTLWGFEVSSPSVLLLPGQPCCASCGSKERQTLHHARSWAIGRDHLPAGTSCIPGGSSPLQPQAGGIFRITGHCLESSFSG